MPHHVKYCYFLLFTLYLLKREKPSRNKNVKIKDIPHVTFYLLFWHTHTICHIYIFYGIMLLKYVRFFFICEIQCELIERLFFVWTKHNINKNRNHAKKKSEIKTSFFVAQIEKVKYIYLISEVEVERYFIKCINRDTQMTGTIFHTMALFFWLLLPMCFVKCENEKLKAKIIELSNEFINRVFVLSLKTLSSKKKYQENTKSSMTCF